MRSPQQEMIVIRHQAEGMDLENAELHQWLDDPQERSPVVLVQKRGHPGDPTRHHVIGRTRILDAYSSTHVAILEQTNIPVKLKMTNDDTVPNWG